MKRLSIVMLAAAAVVAMSARAYAQAGADFTGVWQPRYQEDLPERIPGPELRDYLGLPINDCRAAVRRQLGSVAHHAARRAVPRARLALHLSRADATCASGKRRIRRRRT